MSTSYRFRADSLGECFYFDESDLNPTPKSIYGKLVGVLFNPRYSMTVLMRISQYYYVKSRGSRALKRKLCMLVHRILWRANQVLHNLNVASDPKIAQGIILHHTGVLITTDTIIEPGVHLYCNVTFGEKNGKAPYIKSEAKIASHSVVLGGIVIGEKAIVAPGAVVLHDVPDGKIAAGVPARIIGDVTDENYSF